MGLLDHIHVKARRTDPVTSHMTAEKVEESGGADTQRKMCLRYVRNHPGRTSAEIAAALYIDRYTPSRRLPELRDAGRVYNGRRRVCSVTGNLSLTWRPKKRKG
jgi:hypothetical protein